LTRIIMPLVLPLDMVDKSTSPLQTHFGPVFCHEAVQTGLLFPERGPLRVLLLAPSLISPWHDPATCTGYLDHPLRKQGVFCEDLTLSGGDGSERTTTNTLSLRTDDPS
jgi:hypothetical protein